VREKNREKRKVEKKLKSVHWKRQEKKRERERNEECRLGKTGEEKRERNFLNLII